MNIKEIAMKAGITYPTIRSFITKPHPSTGLDVFRKLVSDHDRKELDEIIERTKNRIKRESGRRSVC
jgi:hypothetical protein